MDNAAKQNAILSAVSDFPNQLEEKALALFRSVRETNAALKANNINSANVLELETILYTFCTKLEAHKKGHLGSGELVFSLFNGYSQKAKDIVFALAYKTLEECS